MNDPARSLARWKVATAISCAVSLCLAGALALPHDAPPTPAQEAAYADLSRRVAKAVAGAKAVVAHRAETVERTRAWPTELTGEWSSDDGRQCILISAIGRQELEEQGPHGDVLVSTSWGVLVPHGELVVARLAGAVVRVLANPRRNAWWDRYTVGAAGELVADTGHLAPAGDDLVDVQHVETLIRPP